MEQVWIHLRFDLPNNDKPAPEAGLFLDAWNYWVID